MEKISAVENNKVYEAQDDTYIQKHDASSEVDGKKVDKTQKDQPV